MAPPLSVTLSQGGGPCAKYYYNPANTTLTATQKLLLQAQYGLCTGWQKLKAAGVAAGHWIWEHIKGLWSEVSNIGQSIGQGVVKAGKWIGQEVTGAAKDIWSHIQGFLNWLDGQLGLAENWLLNSALLVGGLLLAIELAPAAVALVEGHERRHK